MEFLRWIKPRLPVEYRAHIGTTPTVAIGAHATAEQASSDGLAATESPETEPDEQVAVAILDPGKSLFVEFRGRLVAGVELVSPRNKDRPVARATYSGRYIGYLLEGVHLLLVDVHPRPRDFSFADRIAQELQIRQEALPPPFAVSYRVGEPAATGGTVLDIWRRRLTVGEPLPQIVLPITLHTSISVDLEQTYRRAAADAYLD